MEQSSERAVYNATTTAAPTSQNTQVFQDPGGFLGSCLHRGRDFPLSQHRRTQSEILPQVRTCESWGEGRTQL